MSDPTREAIRRGLDDAGYSDPGIVEPIVDAITTALSTTPAPDVVSAEVGGHALYMTRDDAAKVAALSTTPAPLDERLPPGPYRLVWPDEQGGLFSVWGRQGTPPDFADGWAIPLVAQGMQSVMEWLVETLNDRSTP